MAFYTFESKSNKVPIPKQHELRVPFPFKCFYSPPKKVNKECRSNPPHLLLRVMLLSQVINIISLMASFFKASGQWFKEKHTTEKFLMLWPHISTSITSPRRLPNARMKCKCTQSRVSRVNHEKPKWHWLPFNASRRRLQADLRIEWIRTFGARMREGWHSAAPTWVVPLLWPRSPAIPRGLICTFSLWG